MRDRLVVTRNENGIPAARVSSQHLWNLVEFLSCQRVAVSYAYEASCFVVSFPRHDVAKAQRTLDEWAKADAGAGASV